MNLRIACEEGLGSVPEVGYKRTAKTKDEEWRGGKERGNKNATTGVTNN
jgi:hypothetical protein